VIVYDKFHVAKHLNEAVDKVRREEHRRLLERGDKSLTGSKYLWLRCACPDGERALSFADLCARNLKTSRAWYHKETFTEFWAQPSAKRAAKFLQQWFGAARRSKLAPIKKTALTLKTHLFGLLNYFAHPVTNTISEGFNSKIQAIKADARGFRRFENYRYRILFHCGKLDLRPAISYFDPRRSPKNPFNYRSIFTSMSIVYTPPFASASSMSSRIAMIPRIMLQAKYRITLSIPWAIGPHSRNDTA